MPVQSAGGPSARIRGGGGAWLMEMYRKTFAEIDLDALESNWDSLRKSFSPETFLCPMVKANAYGHGDVQVARALESMGARHLGVCLIEEGLLLRNFGVKAEILVFRGFDREGAKKMLSHRLTPVVSSWEHLEHLEAVASGPVEIHLKFDTGMNRLGFEVSEARRLFEKFSSSARFQVKAVLTHLSHGEDGVSNEGETARQLSRFLDVATMFRPLGAFAHALNSAGILSRLVVSEQKRGPHPILAENWGLRPGLMLYGSHPLGGDQGLRLKPVMSLKSQAGVLRRLRPGDGVSYNSTWKASRESLIAVVPIGYADGYHRLLSNRAEALFLGQRAPVVGNICMDYLMLDVTEIAKTQSVPEGQEHEVILFGSSQAGPFLGAEELARHAQTIPWEIFTSVGERVPRRYVGRRAQALQEEVGHR